MTTHALLLEYLTAFNAHDMDKVTSFLHPDCRVIFNDQLSFQGIEAMRPAYEKDFLNPQTSVTLIESNQDTNRIRALLKTQDNRLVDVTYVFQATENQDELNKKKMIEHIIHSVNQQEDCH